MLTFHDFPPHMQLMLLCARGGQSPEEAAQIAALAASPALDWSAFLAVTLHHKVDSLCFNSLERLRPPELPRAIRTELQRSATANAFAAMRSVSAISEATAALSDAGYPLAVLKGVPLSQLLFGSPHARHVGDIDLLTTPRALAEQVALLERLGYFHTNPACRLTPARIRSFRSFWKDFTFHNPERGFDLDLHWRLFNNRFHAANSLAEGSAGQPHFDSVTIFGVPMRVLPPEDHFLYIAAHGMSDAWLFLKSLADVAGFLRLFNQLELDRALLRASSLGLLDQISAAIHLSNDWMGTTAASPHLVASEERAIGRIRRRTERTLLRHSYRPLRAQTSPFQWLLLELALVPGVRSVVEIARRYVWRPRVWTRLDLPDSLFWIYPIAGLLLLPRIHSAED